MEQIYTRTEILYIVEEQLKIMLGKLTGQVEFFQTNFHMEMHGKYPVISISYRGNTISLMVYFTPIKKVDIKNGFAIQLGCSDIYLENESESIDYKIMSHLKHAVGDTIKSFIEENRPSPNVAKG